MCGIAGILAPFEKDIDEKALRLMSGAIEHRGPDGEGVWVNSDASCGLCHRRLAIVDTSAASNQPMIDASGRYVIVFNGEIYNFLELKCDLEFLGSQFRTDGDTEIILEAWRHWGKAMFLKMNGMWALALHDRQTGETLLARDRFGIKPLYYTQVANSFAFASELRALRTLPWFDASLDDEIIRRTIFDPLSIEAGEKTIFLTVKRLPAGHLALIKDGKINVERWWRTIDHLVPIPPNYEQRTEKFHELFIESIRFRMRSDVSIGNCLSGGFDSSAIICGMSRIASGDYALDRVAEDWRKAFIASFPGSVQDETPQALEAAKYAQVQTILIYIDNNDVIGDIDRILTDFEDVYISLPTAIWKTYQSLRSNGTVVSLDGHGADELMGGYQRVGSIGFYARNAIQRFTYASPRRQWLVDSAKSTALHFLRLNFLIGHLYIAPKKSSTPFDADLLYTNMEARNARLYNMFHIDVLPMILRNFDRMSMAHGIEVRMPFMDWRLVCYVMSLPAKDKLAVGYSKKVARDAMKGQMPESIRASKKKVGFNSPMIEWLNGSLGEWAADLLAQPNPKFSEIVNVEMLQKKIAKLNLNKSWDWRKCGKLWPYIHMRWLLGKL
jgi:asparagine synthase (glutamine-hydrolysing)